jgi:molybdate transport system substrate-binding protein
MNQKSGIRCLILICSMVFGIAFLSGAYVSGEEGQKVTVFAAASTTNAVNEIGQLFENREKVKFIVSFASASTLAKQIEQGAPADIFISANIEWMDYLESKKLLELGSRFDLLSNSIVLIAPSDSPVKSIDLISGADLVKFLGDSLLAMGDPDHVPAGTYGMQALKSLSMWQTIENKIARAKDVRAALTLVERGEAPLGIVYATDAKISDKVKVVGVFPKESHPPVVYPVALIAGRKSRAGVKFIEILKSPEAKNIFTRYGFIVNE